MSTTPELPVRLIDALPQAPPRDEFAHKGDSGRVMIIAGSRGMSGAAVLAGLGALRAGAGLVRVACPECVQPVVAATEPSLMTLGLPQDGRGAIRPTWLDELGPQVLGGADVLAIGPGLSADAAQERWLIEILRTFEGPIVLDADALNSLARAGRWWKESPHPDRVLITPHPGEFARLVHGGGAAMAGIATDLQVLSRDADARLRATARFACNTGFVTLLKGRGTVVCSRDAGGEVRAFVNATGNAGMATGGMGDVLTGVCAALLARGMSGMDAGCLAAHVHGAAGDRAAEKVGPIGFTAREVAEAIPSALFESTRARMGFR